MMTERKGGMRCPINGETLLMSERAGIEIDYCPSCRGVWLDRGEFDKIVERSARDSHDEHRHRLSESSQPSARGDVHA